MPDERAYPPDEGVVPMDVVQQLVDGRRAYEERAWATALPAPVRPRSRHPRRRGLPRPRHGRLPGRRPRGLGPGLPGVVPPPRGGRIRPPRRARHLLARADLYSPRKRRRSAAAGPPGAQRLLQDVDPDAVEHGYLLIHEMYGHIFGRGTTRAPSSTRCGSPRRVGGAATRTSCGRAVERGTAAASPSDRCGRGWPCSTRRWSAWPTLEVSPILAGQSTARWSGLPGDRRLRADRRSGPRP